MTHDVFLTPYRLKRKLLRTANDVLRLFDVKDKDKGWPEKQEPE